MASIWVREFTGGLDARKLPETTPGSALVVAQDCHVTDGGAVEQRAAFVEFADVAGLDTFGLYRNTQAILVFGSVVEPPSLAGMNIAYHRLEHPDGPTAMSAVLSTTTFKRLVYVAAQFEDDSIHHYYDAENVEFMFDGRARAAFTLTGAPTSTPAVASSGTLEVLEALLNPMTVSSITIGLTELLSSGISVGSGPPFPSDRALLAAAIAANIAANSGTSGYTATQVESTKVLITATTTGPDPNGLTILPTYDASTTTLAYGEMSGGANDIAETAYVGSVTIDGIEGLTTSILWQGNLEDTAAAIAADLDSNVVDTGFNASSNAASVFLVADSASADDNNKFVAVYPSGGLAVTPETQYTAGGVTGAIDAGSFVKTINKKVYSLAGSVMYFSALSDPTHWTSDFTGAGFVDISEEAENSEQIVSIDRYRQFVAVFAEEAIQIWFVDPDPALYRIVQVLNNTGTKYPKSPTQFGDSDVFYLDVSGIRSLKAAGQQDAASTNDIGVLIDTIVKEHVATLTDEQASHIVGLVEPRSKRFWMVCWNKIFVFSFYANAKVSAWSVYTCSTQETRDGDITTFGVTDVVTLDGFVFLRADNDKIYTYGGLDAEEPTHDATVAKVWTPYLDGEDPTRLKQFQSIDAVARGQWLMKIALDPNQPDDVLAADDIARLIKTTYGFGKLPSPIQGHFVQARFESEGVGPHSLHSFNVIFSSSADED